MTEDQRLAALLAERLDPAVRAALEADPFDTIRSTFGIPVLIEHEVHGECSDEGDYSESPLRIRVVRRESPGRMAFTVVHELGHHLARNDDDVAAHLGVLATRISLDLEERIANSFAGEILVPAALVDEVLGGRHPSAIDVVEMFHRANKTSSASRQAVCMRAVNRFSREGYVTLSRGDSLVFAASAHGAYRIQRDVPQGEDHLLCRAAESGTARGVARICHASGWRTREYHLDAVRDDGDGEGWVFGVLVSDNRPPWGQWQLLSDKIAPPEITCMSCGEQFDGWRKCGTCGQPVCHCGACGCRRQVRVAERVCTSCWTRRAVHLFVGDGLVCRDCRDG